MIPAHNEEGNLPATLASIAEAVAELALPSEVIVADDASTDRTAQVAEEAGARVVSVDVRQIAAARNAGAAVARGEWLVFIDADTQVTPDVIRAAVEALESGAVGGGAGLQFDEPTPRWSKIVLPFGLWLARRIKMAAGCFLFASREEFRAVGGFDERYFAGEELILSRALAKKGKFVIVKPRVLTSGRKLRTHSPWQVLAPIIRIGVFGRFAVRDRSTLDLWYAPRRDDPRDESPPK